MPAWCPAVCLRQLRLHQTQSWEDKDKAGRQSSDQRDHPADIWDEEGEDEGDDKPHQRLQDPPPLLPTHTHLHLLTLETQPKSFYNGPATEV